MNKRKILVLMGGTSVEREPSLMTGKSVLEALGLLPQYEAIPLDPGLLGAEDTILAIIKERKQSELVVFNALHGTYGEDGAVVGALEWLGIPYTHSGIRASAVALDKHLTKLLLSSIGIKLPAGKLLSSQQAAAAKEEPMPRPFVAKPRSQGSSFGTHIILENHRGPWLEPENWCYGDVLVEEFIPGQELSVPVIHGKALGVLELRPHGQFHNYASKYEEGGSEHIYPAQVPQGIYGLAMQWATQAHQVIGCRTLSRSDFRYCPHRGLFMLEINTHPGFTPHSALPDVASKEGITFSKIVEMLIDDATCDLQTCQPPSD